MIIVYNEQNLYGYDYAKILTKEVLQIVIIYKYIFQIFQQMNKSFAVTRHINH